MKDRFRYDAVVKDLFQRDRPSLLDDLTGGVAVKEFLNLELSAVEERVADLLVLLADETILHIDFQSTNDSEMAYREGFYGVMAGWKFRPRKVRQVVVYMGRARMRMADRLDLGSVQVQYRLMDIRELECDELLASGRSGDFALAMLAEGGIAKLRKIVQQANHLPGPQRQRAFTQLAILSGLRGASERLTMEFKTMGISVEIDQNVFLKDIHDSAMTRGMVQIVRRLLEAKFGTLPKWADDRLAKATSTQAERWSTKILTADTIEGVLGRK